MKTLGAGRHSVIVFRGIFKLFFYLRVLEAAKRYSCSILLFPIPNMCSLVLTNQKDKNLVYKSVFVKSGGNLFQIWNNFDKFNSVLVKHV